MTYRKATIAAFATLSLGLGACEGMNTGDTVGTLGGAAGGALLGSQIGGGTGQLAATAVGTLAGALAGQQLSRHLQGNDRQTAIQAEETAITRNEPIQWSSADSDRRGTIEPTRTYQDQAGQTCREYQHTVYIGGRAERANGTACQQPDGSWRIVS
ncbi:glycine zipper 2TM domain-containing protein [Skermanella sp. TT6]|uniref:17 kDa surface antigen n=1 Tax=Skermanella cutis TaxID=2775420 RepID=A0ABX7B0G7_9PROT|nr:RT0821/Lpp0805 family surface protein [Skermanella sp. TT6]QQP87663.1 glycine zipper 2TM domain-containing protein [Skermanella sp. TT6]